MSLGPDVVDTLLSPTAAFLAPEELSRITSRYAACGTAHDAASLAPCRSTDGCADVTWRIDGVESDGGRVFALPLFAIDQPPRRIDVYVADQTVCMRSKDEVFLSCLVRVLQQWSDSIENFQHWYMGVPFGSYIMVQKFNNESQQADIELVPSYDTEQEWLSVPDLQSFWHSRNEQWPKLIDLSKLRLQQQPHEAVSLVTIDGHNSELFVFKSLLFDLKYLYHEIRMLLTVDQHDNIMPRPKYLVSQRAKFGGKVGVCGMILPYYTRGTLHDVLSQDNGYETISTSEKFSWSLGVISGLQHIQNSPMGYFSGLKPTNILLKGDNETIKPVLLDFEQRTGRSPWTPPEIYHVDLIEQAASSNVHPQIVDRYAKLMRKYQPDWKATMRRRPRPYDGRDRSARGPWSNLTEREREKAQVFMLGMLLWCLFEGVGSFSRGLDVESWNECGHMKLFPQFEKTPLAMRECIRKCTIDAAEWRGKQSNLMVVNAKVHERTGFDVGHQLSFGSRGSLEAVRDWWMQELETAERFVKAYVLRRNTKVLDTKDGEMLRLIEERPTLEEVRLMILRARAQF